MNLMGPDSMPHIPVDELEDMDISEGVIDNIYENGSFSRDVTDAAAGKLRKTLHRLNAVLEKLDLDTLEMLGLDAEPFREIDEDLDSVLRMMREYGEEILQKAAAKEKKEHSAKPMWVKKVGSFTDEDESYYVRWDVEHYEQEHADEGEVVHEPHYSCTCKAFLFGSHDGKYCKHIDSVIASNGDDGEMPDAAEEIGKYVEDPPADFE
jgi:hypothetical protein